MMETLTHLYRLLCVQEVLSNFIQRLPISKWTGFHEHASCDVYLGIETRAAQLLEQNLHEVPQRRLRLDHRQSVQMFIRQRQSEEKERDVEKESL